LQDVLELRAAHANTDGDIPMALIAPPHLMTEGLADLWGSYTARPSKNGLRRNGQRMAAKKIPLALFREEDADEADRSTQGGEPGRQGARTGTSILWKGFRVVL
jgi:hypothetical protein